MYNYDRTLKALAFFSRNQVFHNLAQLLYSLILLLPQEIPSDKVYPKGQNGTYFKTTNKDPFVG